MAKPFDATLNALIDAHADDWVAYLCVRVGLPVGPAELIDTDLSVTAQADKVFRLTGPTPALLHLELEANPRLGIPADLLRYNVLLDHQHRLPVHTILLLLRPKANASDLTGLYQRIGADRRVIHEFRYTVVRLWEEPTAALIAGGLGTLPLALLTDEAAADLPTAFAQFTERLREPDITGKVSDGLASALYFLLGLRHDHDQIVRFYQMLSTLLEDSTSYQFVLKKGEALGEARGRLAEARAIVLRIGSKRFGLPTSVHEAALTAIADRERLERMAERIFDAASWDDLLGTP